MSAVRNGLKKYFENYLSMVAPSTSVDENYQFFKETITTMITFRKRNLVVGGVYLG